MNAFKVLSDVNTYNRNMTDIIPNVSHVLVWRQWQRSGEAIQRHVILVGVKATQTKVVVNLCVVDAHL